MSDLVHDTAREGRLFCSVADCGKGYTAWIQCSLAHCPKIAALRDRGRETEEPR